jgi:hypothetical protein
MVMIASRTLLRGKAVVARHPVMSFLVVAHAILWMSWCPILFFAAPPRLFSAAGAVVGLALPAFLVTGATHGWAGVRGLLRRTLRWRVGSSWWLFAVFTVPITARQLGQVAVTQLELIIPFAILFGAAVCTKCRLGYQRGHPAALPSSQAAPPPSSPAAFESTSTGSAP